MLRTFVLPFQITAGIVLAILVVGLFVLSVLRVKGRWPYEALVALLVVASVPLFLAINAVMDRVRYGEFHYATVTQIEDPYIRLPPSATQIELFKFAHAHEAKFQVESGNLKTWLEQEGATLEPGFDPMLFKHRFKESGWEPEDGLIEYQGPSLSRGARFTVWHHPKSSRTYLKAWYW